MYSKIVSFKVDPPRESYRVSYADRGPGRSPGLEPRTVHIEAEVDEDFLRALHRMFHGEPPAHPAPAVIDAELIEPPTPRKLGPGDG